MNKQEEYEKLKTSICTDVYLGASLGKDCCELETFYKSLEEVFNKAYELGEKHLERDGDLLVVQKGLVAKTFQSVKRRFDNEQDEKTCLILRGQHDMMRFFFDDFLSNFERTGKDCKESDGGDVKLAGATEDRRMMVATAAMQGLLSSGEYGNAVNLAIKYADALIEELNKKGCE